MLDKKNIKDIYTLTPMQEGMLFHSLYDKTSSAYFEQASYHLRGRLDVALVRNSLNELLKRYDVLRTVFVYEGVDRPIQVVLKRREIDFYYEDISDMATPAGNEKEAYIKQFKEKEKQRPFNLSKDVLMRVALILIGKEEYEFIWSFHHILIDGWCLNILVSDYLAIYESLLGNRPHGLPEVRPYRDYIVWLEKQDKNAAVNYWRKYLEGYEVAVGVPRLKVKAHDHKAAAYDQQGINLQIESDTVSALDRVAKGNNTTMNTIMQSVWGILLGKYNYTNDVVFGAVVSGRPLGIPGIESMIGLFINTIPVRIRYNGEMKCNELLRDVQKKALAGDRFQYSLLANIQSESPLKQNLLDHIVVFENYPMAEGIEGMGSGSGSGNRGLRLEVINTESFEQTNYDINIIIIDGAPMNIRFLFNRNVYDEDFVGSIARHVKNILVQIADNDKREIREIVILSEEEKQRLLVEFNTAAVGLPGDQTVFELFEAQTAKTPDNIALLGKSLIKKTFRGNVSLTYKELNEKSGRLACVLREKGVQPDTIVGIMVERSLEMMIGIMAVLKSGGAYLPIELNYPQERIRYMLADSNTRILLSESSSMSVGGVGKWDGEVVSLTESVGEKKQKESRTLPPLTGSAHLAYIIYTSGTTGKPKGTLTSHANVLRVVKNTNYIDLTQEDRILQLSNYAFDGSVFDIYGALLNGAGLVLIEAGEVLAVDKLSMLIKREAVTVFFITTALFNALVDAKIDCFTGIRKVLFGGENVSVEHSKRVLDYLGKGKVMHVYGPTETTVYATYYNINGISERAETIPIGAPLSKTSIYILDKELKPVPAMIYGEIYIGGEGVARGYLNRPELTMERFVEVAQGRTYRTGDLACWLPDGNVEFKGRIDQQVKIRGFRIETGEIEFHLLKHNWVKEAVTVPRQGKAGMYLCAYIISEDNFDKSGSTSMAVELRKYLSQFLPDYMIPAYFVTVEEFPLNPNGKVDHKLLPDPGEIDLGDGSDYEAPRSEKEKKVVEIWQSVLGKGKIGIKDNFFTVGGDSIKAIQIISRLNREGYKAEIRDLFSYPTIAELALQIIALDHLPDQSEIKGEVPLTPIQERFFSHYQIDPHHFNQSVMFYSKEGFDEKAVISVFKKIQAHHDALRMTYRTDAQEGRIRQTDHGLDYPFSLQVFDFRNRADGVAALQDRANDVQSGIDLEKGPLMKLALFRLNDGDRLLIVIHHLVIDGVSWRILFEDIGLLMQQYEDGKPLTLPPKSDSFKKWAETLCRYADSPEFLKEKSYWMGLESRDIPELQKDFVSGNNYIKDTAALTFSLSREETQKLVTKVNGAFGTDINDILLTALGLGINKAFGCQRVLIALEGHGREEILENVNINRTVGWFTTVYPVVLEISGEEDLSRQIKEMKETLRKVPDKGIGYGILKYLTAPEHKEDMTFQLSPRVSFNYLGQFDTDVRQTSLQIAGEPGGDQSSSNALREFELDIAGMIENDRLGMMITYSKNQYRGETIETLRDHFQAELRHIIAYCSAREYRELTPGDFTYKDLSIETVDRLCREYSVEDLYPLTPMQEGMLFHALYNEASVSYFEQMSYRFHGELDIALVEKSLNGLIERHDILRTAFVHKGLDRPLQVVLKERQVDFYYEDIGNLKDKEEFIEKFKEKDKERPFNLSEDVLMRVSILRLEPAEYEVIWSFHHILMDGWSLGILNGEFFDIYNSYLADRSPRLPTVKPYRTYIEWLEKQDKDASGRYWQEYLDSYEETAVIPKTKVPGSGEVGYKSERSSFILDGERTTGLKKIAEKNHVTLNIITQALWGIILGRYNGREDVVFGLVVSGRPPGIEDVESMVGLFISAIPVRIRHKGKTTFKDLVQKVQQSALESELHHYYPLAEIQTRSALKQNLLDHIFVFENYPVAEQIEGHEAGTGENPEGLALRISNIAIFEQTNYDFNVIIVPGTQLSIGFNYNGNVHDRDFVERIPHHFTQVVDRIIADDSLKIERITLLSREERNRVLYDFNNVEAGYPRDRTIHQLFEEQVERTPDQIALVGPKLRIKNSKIYLTYKELNKASAQLAQVLMGKGVRPGAIAAVMVEPSLEMIVGVLGILKAGGAYLPIDPGYPADRVEFMLKDSNTAIVLNFENLNFDIVSNFEFRASNLSSSELAYIIYTSGSTGKPKGVMIRHRSLNNLCYWHNSHYSVTAADRATKYAGFGFDASVWEIFPYLITGASLYVVPDEIKPDIEKLNEYFEINRITVAFLPTQVCEQFMGLHNRSLRILLTGGDKLNEFIKRDYQLVNNYGPTENTVVSTCFAVNRRFDNIPIGKPVTNTTLYVLDTYHGLQPPGVPGELCLSGDGLAVGYLNRPELTAEKFVVNPYRESHRERLYHSGDLVRWRFDGNIEFLGRIDQQVKIRGFRIEPGEIESQLAKHGDIKEAVVVERKGKEGENQLTAYIVVEKEKECDDDQLRDYLAKTLPFFMIPSFFIRVKEIPLTPNGKVDRKVLPEPEISGREKSTPPRDEVEKKLAEIWSEVLGVEKDVIDIDYNFFRLGGHSLKVTVLAAKIHKEFNMKLSLVDIFQTPTIRGMSSLINVIHWADDQNIDADRETEEITL